MRSWTDRRRVCSLWTNAGMQSVDKYDECAFCGQMHFHYIDRLVLFGSLVQSGELLTVVVHLFFMDT